MAQDFIKVDAKTQDIQPSQKKQVIVGGKKICIANVDGKFYAIGDECTHQGSLLSDTRSSIEGYEIQCYRHGSKFDLRTGQVTNPPAIRAEPIYEIKIDGNDILVKL